MSPFSSVVGRLMHNGRFQVPSSRAVSSRASRVFRRLPWGAGLAVLAVVLLAVSGKAQAAVVMTNLSSGQLQNALPVAQGGTNNADVAGSKTISGLTITPGNILVVELDLYTTNNTGGDVNPIVTWGGVALTKTASAIGGSGGYPNADIFVLNNPSTSGNLVFSYTSRSCSYDAMALDGVNTNIAPLVSTTAANATTAFVAFSGANAPTINGSFAAVAESERNNATATTPYFTSCTPGTAGSAAQLFNFFDGNQNQSGGAVVSNISAGSLTITSTVSAYGGGTNRNELAAVIFTPYASPTSALVWAGTAGSGVWDVAYTKNWQTQNGLYIEPNVGVVFDDTAGTLAGATTNVVATQVVSPQSIAFNNNAYTYTLSGSGAGAISGTGAVTLSGTGLVSLNMANTYSGGTTVSAGTLQIGNASGSATGTGPVAIAAGATLTGSGFMSPSGANVVSVSGSITPDSSPGIYNTLTASALTLNNGSTLNLSFSTTLPGQHDLINVTGLLTLGSGTININAANLSGTWTPGAYPILGYSTSNNFNPTFNLTNTSGALGTSGMSIDESVPNVISLDVLSVGHTKTVSWAGNVNTGGSYLWDIATTPNWSGASVYSEGNVVVFSNTASNFVVTVDQQVNPTSVMFSNSSNAYTLNGSGGIQGTSFPVAISGGGTVTFNNTNTYPSATTVANGSTLIVNGSLPNSNVLVTGASIGGTGQLAATPVSLTLNGATALTAGSDLQVQGPANVVSGTFTIPASATLSGTGGINVSSGAQLALGGIVDVNQVVNLNGVLSGSGTVNGGVNLTSGTLAPVGALTLNGAVTNSGTSILGSGVVSAGGAWTGSGAINVASGSDLLLSSFAITGSNLTLNISGTLDGTSGAPVNSTVNVLGSGSATINAGTVPALNASGGTTNLAGATVNVATVSGSNAVLNVNSGSTVPVLNVVNSDLTSGVTVFPGASACTTSASVSGGLVTLQNSDIIPTAALSGGTINWAGPTGNTTTVSGASTVVSVTAGQLSRLIASGGSTTVGSLATAFTATVSGNAVVNLNNANIMPILTASGGTTNFAGPTGTVATISGTNTVVNITAGSVPTLNVTNSSPIGGVTAGTGASVGTTALNVSGGLVNLYDNFDTIPTAALSGGTTNFSGPNVTTANVSGAAVVNVNTGSLTTLYASGNATTTVSSSATVTNATVYGGVATLSPTSGLSSLVVAGGRVNVSSTSALSLLAVSGGTVTLPPGTTTVTTANFSSGAAASVTANPLVVTNQLTFNGGAAAAVSGGNSFTYATSGGNLANTSAPSTLTLSGGTLQLTGGSTSLGAPIDITFQRTNGYTGQGAAASGPLTQIWNVLAPGVANDTNITAANNLTNLLDSSGSTLAGTTFGLVAGNAHVYQQGTPAITLFGNAGLVKQASAAPPGPSATWALSGLTASAYDVYAIRSNANQGGQIILNGDPVTFPNQASSGTAFIMNPVNGTPPANCNYTVFASVAPVGGSISITEAAAAATGNEFDISGYQFVPHLPVYTAPVSLPNTNIVAPAGSTLDFGGFGPANAVGALSLAGNLTVQNVLNGGSVQFGGDVVASADATISLAAGAGSVPTLVVSGNTAGVQKISAANGTTLTLPAVSISAATVKFNPSGGTGSVVVLSGATALTYAGGAAATLNAGTLKVSDVLSGAAGANLEVKAGTTLVGGPAASIQVPVTLDGGSTLLPDATAASTALIGNTLTINGGGALQWVYSSSGAEGTLALGSAGTLNLSNFNIPVFRPQFVTVPSSGTSGAYVVTWTSPPANQPAWAFDGSLSTAGHTATWADGNGNWDTGANWSYAVCTGATLSYQPSGLQLTGLNVSNVAGTAPPVTGASVLIVPPSTSSVSVTGPAEPVSLGVLVVEGSNSATASLALQSAGPISVPSVSVGAGGSLSDDLGGGGGALVMPSGILTLSQGSVSLGDGATIVGAATMNSGVFSLSGGNIGILTASGGAPTVSGGTVGTAQVSGAAALNATGGALNLLTASGGSATVAAPATLSAATVSGGVVNLSNANGMSLTASGGVTTLNGPTVTTAAISGNAVVNVTGGNVQILNVVSSDPTTGVTGQVGATVGSTSLGVSGGLVTLYNTTTIPIAILSGGTTNLFGPTVNTANVAGNALVNVSGSTLAAANVSGNAVVNANAANSVTAANVSGSGLLNLNVANAVAGPTLISGGTVNVADAAGQGLQQSTVTVNGNNGLAYSVPTAVLGGLSGSASFNLPSSTLTVGANGANTNFTGTMGGAGGLTKVGSGTLLLSNSNVYAGPTQVNAGTLKLINGGGLAVSGFNNGTGWSVNSIAEATPAFSGGTLTLTDNNNGVANAQARSVWYGTPVATNGFSASFIYTVGGNKTADGMTFCLQTAGTAALDPNSTGGNLGYYNIKPSVAVPLNFYPATSQTGQTVWTDGVLGAYLTTGTVNIASGDPIQVTLTYNGATQTLTEKLVDSVSGNTFTTTYANVNVPGILGGSTTAYVGFTGAENATALQTVSNFTLGTGGSASSAVSILPPTTALVVSPSGTVDLGGNNQTVASLSDGVGGGGSVINSFPALASVLTVSSTGGSSTFSGSIEGGGGLGTLGLTVSGSGTLVLAGTNTYAGGTYVEGNATLMTGYGDNEAIADGSDLFVGSAAGLMQFGGVVSAGAAGQAASRVAPVPEPGSLALLAAAAAAAVVFRGRRMRTLRKR